jgi:CHAT domain-containing protein
MAKEYYDKAMDFYLKNQSNYKEIIEFYLSITYTDLYDNEKILDKSQELAILNHDDLLSVRISLNKINYYLFNKEMLKAEIEINNSIRKLNNLLIENYDLSFYKLQLNILNSFVLISKGKDAIEQKEYIINNFSFLNEIMLHSIIDFTDCTSSIINILGTSHPICKTLLFDGQSYLIKNDLENTYESLYFGIIQVNYLLMIEDFEEALKVCKNNLNQSKKLSFFDLIAQYDFLMNNIYQGQGNLLEYGKNSEFSTYEETGQNFSVTFTTKSIGEVFKLRNASENEKIKYLDFLLSQCEGFSSTDFQLEWINGALRDARILKGKNNSFYSAILAELANYYLKNLKFKKSLRTILKSYNINSDLYSTDPDRLNDSKEHLIPFLLNNKKYEILDSLLISISNFKIEKLNESFYSFNPDELLNLKVNYENFYSFYVSYNIFRNSFELNLNSIYLFWRSLNGLSNSKNVWINEQLLNDANFEKESKQLRELKSELSLLRNSDILSEKRLNDSIIKIQKTLEIALLKKQLKNEKVTSSKNLNYDFFIDISKINLLNFESKLWIDSTGYIAYITDSTGGLVDYVYFESGSKIEGEIYNQYINEATNESNKTDLKSNVFYENFWKSIDVKIINSKTIYVSLGGVFNNININTIYNPETGKYLIEEKDIHLVNSTRDLILGGENIERNYTTNNASIFGFPNFDGITSFTSESFDLFASNRDLSSFWLNSLTRGGMIAKPLPETKKEVENISNTLKLKGWKVNSFLADYASETNIKKLQSPRILHIATHGYFFQDIPMEDGKDRFLGIEKEKVIQDPMLRSGLLLSGANKTLKGEVLMGENGLLSAAEASLLDLRETELVVLSACETGKGEVKNSEGVYGLRKAFTDAGAQNIIMSLWKVDDKVTQEFMSRFYEIWLNEKTTIRQAFNRTQLEIKAKYPEPYYWGAFILVGE